MEISAPSTKVAWVVQDSLVCCVLCFPLFEPHLPIQRVSLHSLHYGDAVLRILCVVSSESSKHARLQPDDLRSEPPTNTKSHLLSRYPFIILCCELQACPKSYSRYETPQGRTSQGRGYKHGWVWSSRTYPNLSCPCLCA